MRGTFGWVLAGMLIAAAWLPGCGVATAAQEGIRVVSSDGRGMVIELQLPAFTLEEAQGADGAYRRIDLPGWASTAEVGFPRLPVGAALVQAPESGDISVEILEDDQELLTGLRIIPVARPGSDDETGGSAAGSFEKDEAVYASSELYPGARVEVSERQYLRDDCLVRVSVRPFQFNASAGELRVSKKLKLALHFENPLPPLRASSVVMPVSADSGQGDEVFSRMLSRTVLGYASREYGISPDAAGSAESGKAAETTGKIAPAVELSGKSLRIEIKKDGIYRITYEDLLSKGCDPASIDPSTLRMLNRGSEVAIKVVSALADRLGPGDTVELYGRGLDNSYTDTNVYWLTWGEGAGKRIESTDGAPTGLKKRIDSFTDRLHFEEDRQIWPFTPGAPSADHWFWEKLTAPAAKTYTIPVTSLAPHQPPALLLVGLQGVTTMAPHPDHHTQVLLNGELIGDATWDGDSRYVCRLEIPEGLLKEGDNTVGITLPNDTGAAVDTVYLNWIEVRCRRPLQAEHGRLSFGVRGEGRLRMEIERLGASDVRLFDITDPTSPREVVGALVEPSGKFYTAAFEDEVNGKKNYCIMAASQVKRPVRLSAWKPANLAGPDNDADYILITSRAFRKSVAPLARYHRNQGMRVKLVAVENIYNEFNDGIFHPSAIRRFLKAAYANWQKPAPTFVLLVGDANADFRDHYGTGKKNIVPAHLSITEGIGLTPDDGWYGSVHGGDLLPDMLIGRLSAATPEDAAKVCAKVVAYENAGDYRPDAALFIADDDETAFETISDELMSAFPKSYSARKIYLSEAASPKQAREDIMAAINEGMLLTTYAGHGNTFYWAEEKIFDSPDVALLENGGKLTFVTSLDCGNSFFAHPYQYSLAELFVITPDKGAIGSFSPSGTGFPWEHELLGNAFFSAVFQDGDNVLGSFTTRAKIEAYANGTTEDFLKNYSLVGDPASRLKTGK